MQLNDSTVGVFEEHLQMTSRELTPGGPYPQIREPKHRILLQFKTFRFTIGRHYYQLIPIFSLIFTASAFLIQIVFSSTNQPLLRLSTASVCTSYPLLFLALVFSNPGLNENVFDSNAQYCTKCRIGFGKSTYHCQICGVCVPQYHHHSILLGKCIGRDNIGLYKAWQCCTYFYTGYLLVSLFICTLMR